MPRWNKTLRYHLLQLLTVCSVFALPSITLAMPVVVNGGFEDISGEADQSPFTFGALNGWELYDPSVGGITSEGDGPTYYIGTLTPELNELTADPNDYRNFPDGAFEGERVAIAFNDAGSDVSNNGTEYGLEQTLDDSLAANTLQANTKYTLTVAIGNIDTGIANGQTFELGGFPGYRVELLAGGQMIAEDNNTLAGTIPDGEFRLSTVMFTTGASHASLGAALGIRLVNLNVIDAAFPDSDLEVDFDDVQLSAVLVPLPPAALLFASVLVGFGRKLRRV